MLKFIIGLFCAFSFQSYAQIPQYEWSANLEWVNEIQVNSVVTDPDSNVIVVGHFNSWQDLDPGPAELLVQGNGTDLYVMKLDYNGDLIWVKVFGSESPSNQRAVSVVSDSIGNIYVNGFFEGSSDSVDFDPGSGQHKLAPANQKFGFIFSLDEAGNYRWAYGLEGFYGSLVGNPHFNKMAYSPDGFIVLSAQFSGTKDLDPTNGTFMATSTGNSFYTLKLNLNGNFVWVNSLVNGVVVRAIDINGSNDIFLTGYFQGSPDFNTGIGVTTLISNGIYSDGFVLKLDQSGNFLRVTGFGGTSREVPYDITCDDLGHSYISGFFEGTTDLDPSGSLYNATAVGNEDNFVLHLDDQGSFVWALTMPVDPWFPELALTVDASNNLYMAGSFRDTVDIDPTGSTHELISYPSSILTSNVDFFCSKHSPTGAVIWSTHIGGENAEYLDGLFVAPNGDVHLVGSYDDSVDFDPGPGVANYSCIGGDDGYNLKLSQCYQSNPIPDVVALSDTTSSCSVAALPAPIANEFCLGTIVGTPDVTFPITTMGTTIVTWTYDAGNGFLTTQTQNVSIIDTVAPVPNQANLANVAEECSVNSLTPPGATDNCSSNVFVTSNAIFPILANTTITWAYDDGNGNASTQTQNVVITTIDNGISQINGTTLSAVASGYQYQWVDCDNGNAPINGATNQTFVATSNGNYAVEVSDGTCTETSNCLTIDEVSLNEIYANSKIFIYPNPSNEWFTISSEEELDLASIQITNELGQKVSFKVKEENGEIEISISAQSGIYYLSIDGVGVYPLIRL